MRLAAAIAVVAVAFAAAVYIHQRITWNPKTCAGPPYSCANHHSSWQDPVAVLIAIGGLAGAAAIMAARRAR